MDNVKIDSGDLFGCGVFFLFLGLFVGAVVPSTIQNGTHDYSAFRIVTQDKHTTVRAVVSPSSKDDRTVETIMDGKLISRTHPDNFDRIWEEAR